MENNYFLRLTRFTNFGFTKADVEGYLEECNSFNEEVSAQGFLEFIYGESFNPFNEEVEDTDIEDASQFHALVKELKKND